MLTLEAIPKNHKLLKQYMQSHYSQPKGFVGRQLHYLIKFNGVCYGAISGGSSTKFLPGRNEFFKIPYIWTPGYNLECIVNNTFFHCVKYEGSYPLRNFTTKIIKLWRETVVVDWKKQYLDPVIGFETLVELPRKGECYIRDCWQVVGQTQGYTCKREPGVGTDAYTGKRVWDTLNLRPKLVLVRSS